MIKKEKITALSFMLRSKGQTGFKNYTCMHTDNAQQVSPLNFLRKFCVRRIDACVGDLGK